MSEFNFSSKGGFGAMLANTQARQINEAQTSNLLAVAEGFMEQSEASEYMEESPAELSKTLKEFAKEGLSINITIQQANKIRDCLLAYDRGPSNKSNWETKVRKPLS